MKNTLAESFLNVPLELRDRENRIFGIVALHGCTTSDEAIAEPGRSAFESLYGRAGAPQEIISFMIRNRPAFPPLAGSLLLQFSIMPYLWKEEVENGSFIANKFTNKAVNEIPLSFLLRFAVHRFEARTKLDAGIRLALRTLFWELFPALAESYEKYGDVYTFTQKEWSGMTAALRCQVYRLLKQNGVEQINNRPIGPLFEYARNQVNDGILGTGTADFDRFSEFLAALPEFGTEPLPGDEGPASGISLTIGKK